MLAKQPEDRYQTMREVLEELERVRRSGMVRRSIQIGPDDAEIDEEASTVTLRAAEVRRRTATGGKQDSARRGERAANDASAGEDSAFLVISPRQGKSDQAEPHAADRRAAQWVLAMGGGVVIVEIDGRRRRVNDVDDLPVTPFVLETVGLAYNQLLADADLHRFSDVTQLRRMYLDGTNISDAALRHLPGIASLSHLALGNTKVSDAGVAELVACRSLRQVSLYGTPVTDACLAHLQRLTKLEKLNLCRSHLTAEAVAELRRGLPRCEIVY